VLKGFNYRMEGIQGAVLRVKLRHLDAWTDARRQHAACYDDLLTDSGVKLPVQAPYAHHVYHVYAVRTRNRDKLQDALNARGIQTGIHYPIPVHMQKAYGNYGFVAGDLPITEQAAEELLSLPMFPELRKEQVEAVARAVREVEGGS
jgi:dTDP-4-amino-4,6-dideoxygalactose transaminase